MANLFNGGDGNDKTSSGDNDAGKLEHVNPERNATGSLMQEARATNADQFKSFSEGMQSIDPFGINFGDGTVESANYTEQEVDGPGNGSAETGTFIDYSLEQTGPRSFSLGIDYEVEEDTRTPSEKMGDFLQAAAARETDPASWQKYIDGQVEKFIGIGEGLNIAKEHTKEAVAAGWTALIDGTVANFLSKPNAINEPLFKAVGGAFDSMAQDPNAVNHALEVLGTTIMQASEHYSSLPPREQGHVIGETAFFMVNPEGSTEAGEAALKIADTVATHVDKAVLNGIRASVKAADEMAASAPVLADQSRRMLYDYTRKLGLSPQEMELAGIPKGYFDGIEPIPGATKGDNVFAMSGKSNEGERLPRRAENVEREPMAERMPPSERFVAELKQAIEGLDLEEREFLRSHNIEIKPVHRISDFVPGKERLGACYSPEHGAILVPEEILRMGKWIPNDDVPFATRHEFGHVLNAKESEQAILQGKYISDKKEFIDAYNRDVANLKPGQFEELQLNTHSKVGARDEVFSDMYAHVSWLEGSYNPYSQKLKDAFPNFLKVMEEMFK